MRDEEGRGRQEPTSRAGGAENDQAHHECQRLAHAAEVHQLELELQNRALREARAELEASWARYAELYDYAPVGHVTLDAFGTIRQVNLTGAALLGRERRQLEGFPLRMLLEAECRSALDGHLRACVSSRAPRAVELVVDLPGEPGRPIELVTAPRAVAARGAEEILYHSAMIDVSERKRAEARREELLRREHEARLLAESANQVKEDFLAVAAHELRSPLSPIFLWLRALRLRGADEALRTRALAAVEGSLRAHLAMIDEMVDVARGQHGELRVERAPIDLRPVVGNAVEALSPSSAQKMITVELSLPLEPAFVSGDAVRLRQVATNLLSNAVKFTPEGGRVAVGLSLVDDQVVLSVSDDGEGLDPDRLEDVFEPFHQRVKTRARGWGGLGLGLTIVRQLVAAHEGVVRADSAGRGKGATFTVSLPRIHGESAASGGLAAGTKGGDAQVLAGLRILVVEDEIDTRTALTFVLEACGATVLPVGSAGEAWAVSFGAASPHVIVSDIGLPDEDGCSFMRRFRHRESQQDQGRTTSIALTAHTAPRDRARVLLSGFDRHVRKPIAFEELVSAIASSRSGARR